MRSLPKRFRAVGKLMRSLLNRLSMYEVDPKPGKAGYQAHEVGKTSGGRLNRARSVENFLRSVVKHPQSIKPSAKMLEVGCETLFQIATPLCHSPYYIVTVTNMIKRSWSVTKRVTNCTNAVVFVLFPRPRPSIHAKSKVVGTGRTTSISMLQVGLR